MLKKLFCLHVSCKSVVPLRQPSTSKFLFVLFFACCLFLNQAMLGTCSGQDAQAAATHLYFFTDHGCAPCRQVEPSIEALKREGYPVSTVYLSSNREKGAQFGVDRTPTVVLMTGNKMAGRHAGLIDAVTLKKWFAAVGMPTGSVFKRISGKAGSVGGTKVVMPEGGRRISAVGNEFTTPTIHKGTARPANFKESLAMQATVRLKVEDPKGISFATGTVIHNHQGECLVMTCGHVFRDAQGKGAITAEFGFSQGDLKTAPGQLIFYDADARDIALVAIRTSESIKPVPIASRVGKIARGDDIFSIGCDHGEDPTIRRSKIKNKAAYDGAIKYDIYGRPVDGRSGGGLFNDNGELIGVCNAAAVEVDEGIYTALDTIYWQLAKVNLEHLFDDSTMLASRSNNQRNFPNEPATDLSSSASLGANANLRSGSVRPKSRLASLNPATSPVRNSVRGDLANADAMKRTPVAWNQSGRGDAGYQRGTSSDSEVIIIVRSKSDPARAEAITVSDPSPKLLDYLGSMKSNSSVGSRQLDMANWRELN